MTAPSQVGLRGFGYRPAGATRWAVRDVDLSIAAGEKVLLLGPSGSGKSTLLRAMAGLLDAGGQTVGEVTLDGLPAASTRDRVGLLLQDPDAGLVLTRAAEDVAFGPQNRGLPAAEVTRRVRSALDAVGFDHPDRHPVASLSGGERQRLAFAGVLALEPGVLLLDEPTSMLDPRGAALVREAVTAACDSSGCTLVVVEHAVEHWVDVVDRVVVLGRDGVEADGDVDQVRRTAAAASTWLAVPPVTDGAPLRDPGPSLLQAEQVRFCHRGSDRPALESVNVELAAAVVVALVGDNGSGKTTLARLLGGLAAPTSGRVAATPELIGRARLPVEPYRWRAPELAGRIGSVFQNPEHSFLTARVRDELAVGPRALGHREPEVAARSDELLERLRLDPMADQNPFTLSGGEQRRLSVAAAIATSPRVLILDEPTFGQDPATWHEIATLVASMATEDAAVAVATHDRRFRDAVAHRTLRLESGGASS